MSKGVRLKRFSVVERLFHFVLMITFLIQAGTGYSRLYYVTSWGKMMTALFGGYETVIIIHKTTGVIMMIVFGLHLIFLAKRIPWKSLPKFVLGPDSLIPGPADLKLVIQQVLWFFHIGSQPKYDRWTYWEKFDYFAVFWGLPLLAGTGLMLMFPHFTTHYVPGWYLNVASILHEAEALLATGFIFTIHFFVGHVRPINFPMNEAMFAGSIHMEELEEEKQAWLKRLKDEGRYEEALTTAPATWFRVLYYIFGLSAVAFGFYLFVNAVLNSAYIGLF